MTIRDATVADASSIAAISIEVWIGTYLRRGVSDFFADFALDTFTKAKTESLITDQEAFTLVSENVDGIDGFIRVVTGQEAPVAECSTTEIATFYVQPRHHGKGVGRTLLEAALARCREVDTTSVWLATNAENAPAISVYLNYGFVEVGQTHFQIEDQVYLNNVYRLTLT